MAAVSDRCVLTCAVLCVGLFCPSASAQVLETVDVDLSGTVFVSAGSYPAGSYEVTGEGFYVFDPAIDGRSDVAWTWVPATANDPTQWNSIDRIRLLSTDGSDIIPWQEPPNLMHTYTALIDHNGGPIRFMLNDGFTGDNQTDGPFVITIANPVPEAASLFLAAAAVIQLLSHRRRRFMANCG